MTPTPADFGLEPNGAVFTCARVVEGAPILHVSHDVEGDWQFLCGGTHADGGCPGKLVGIGELLQGDATLGALSDLCEGWTADRIAPGEAWVRHYTLEDTIRQNIAEYGWHVTIIPPDEEGPGFAYSIGLFKTFKRPEVILFGIPADVMHSVINEVGERCKAGKAVPTDVPLDDFLEGYPVVFKPVKTEHYREYFGYGLWYYKGPQFPAVQCVWPDKQGRFPWDTGFHEEWRRFQPHLS